jgi:phage terminase large subunit GpA-like protein
MFGSNAPGRIRRFKGAMLYADEIDAIHIQQNDEGNILLIFKKRGAEYADVIEIYCSYPSLKGRSNIESKMLTSDWRQWVTDCALCGNPVVMTRTGLNPHKDPFERTKLIYDREAPQEARLECPHCRGHLTDSQRYAMMMGGDPKKPRYDLWRPTLPFTGKAGFQANAMLWPHPVDPVKYPGGFLQLVAQQEIDAENADNPERAKRVIVNTIDSETFEAACDVKPEHSILFKRREKWDPAKMLPAGVLWCSIQWDSQADRAEGEMVGFGLKGRTWGLGYHVIKGSPMAAPNEGIWAEMDRLFLVTTFAHPSGKTLRFGGELVDRGYKPDNVLAYTRPRAKRGTFASRGATSLSKPIVRPKAGWEGNPRAKVWEIGTHEAKDIIYQRLERDNASADGYMHYPEIGCYSEQYFKGLVVEDSDMQKANDGKFYRCFTCEQGVRNEPLDLRVLALAIERIRKPKYAKLAIDLAVPDPGSSDAGKSAQTPVSKPAPAKATPRKFVGQGNKGGFVSGWKRRR